MKAISTHAIEIDMLGVVSENERSSLCRCENGSKLNNGGESA
jgi:hypothetical protein